MKKYLLFSFFISLIVLIQSNRSTLVAVETIHENYMKDMATFRSTTKILKEKAASALSNPSELQTAFKNARIAYKRIAWLLGYIEPANEKIFNGAPLLKVEERFLVEIQPQGFQPIEEIVFSDEPCNAEDLEKLQGLVHDLDLNAQRWQQQMSNEKLADREIFEAFRTELTQMFTLSFTGFDSPVAFHSLPEAATAWQTIHGHLNAYQSAIVEKDPTLAKNISQIATEGTKYLAENQDFNRFDRLFFFKKYLNPQYENIVKAQKTLAIEFYDLTSGLARAWNDEAESLFAKDFIKPYLYSDVKDKKYADSPERIALGEKLFFDTFLSKDGKRACASCHLPQYAYAEPLAQSLSVTGKALTRNAPSLSYSAYASSQFWDGRVTSVELQLAHVATNSDEMGSVLEEIPSKLATRPDYTTAFDKAFPSQSDAIRVENIEKAVGAYLRSIANFDSPFDQYMRGETTTIDKEIATGFNLFMGKGKCGTCHFAPVFNGTVPPFYLETEFEVLGVPNEKNKLDVDLGRYYVVPHDVAKNAFKTVTVRNTAKSAPYMHNGRYKNLHDVVDFYNKGGSKGLGFELSNQTLPFDHLSLSRKEANAIVKFMESLSDK